MCENKLKELEKEIKELKVLSSEKDDKTYDLKNELEAAMKKKPGRKWFSFRKTKVKKNENKEKNKKGVDLATLPPISALGMIVSGAAIIEPSSKGGDVKTVIGKIEEEANKLEGKKGVILLTKPMVEYQYTPGDGGDLDWTGKYDAVTTLGGKRRKKKSRRRRTKKKKRRRKKKTRKKRKKRKRRRRTKKN
jgi:hypothetical protein